MIYTPQKGETILSEVRVSADLSAEPVSLAALKLHLKVDNTADDDLITNLGIAARESLEQYSGLSFGIKTLVAYYETFGQNVTLPYGPLDSITSVVTKDADNTATTLTADSDYYLKGSEYPVFWFNQWGLSLEITYVTKAPNTSKLALIEAAIKKTVSSMYEFREDFVSGTIISKLPADAQRIMDSISRNTVTLFGF